MAYKDDDHKKHGALHTEGMDDGYMGMIHSDYSAPSNLPQHVVHKYYPKCEYMDSHYLDDTIHGIDDNLDDSVRKVDHHQSDSMY
jgi:hypothetical protein